VFNVSFIEMFTNIFDIAIRILIAIMRSQFNNCKEVAYSVCVFFTIFRQNDPFSSKHITRSTLTFQCFYGILILFLKRNRAVLLT
jgi:hypothetical protein